MAYQQQNHAKEKFTWRVLCYCSSLPNSSKLTVGILYRQFRHTLRRHSAFRPLAGLMTLFAARMSVAQPMILTITVMEKQSFLLCGVMLLLIPALI